LVEEAVVDIRRPLQLHGPVEVEQQFGLQAIQSGHEPELALRLAEVSRVEMDLINLPVVVVDQVDQV
jgi:hypothetical protein